MRCNSLYLVVTYTTVLYLKSDGYQFGGDLLHLFLLKKKALTKTSTDSLTKPNIHIVKTCQRTT